MSGKSRIYYLTELLHEQGSQHCQEAQQDRQEAARKRPSAYGARPKGAGFGAGCSGLPRGERAVRATSAYAVTVNGGHGRGYAYFSGAGIPGSGLSPLVLPAYTSGESAEAVLVLVWGAWRCMELVCVADGFLVDTVCRPSGELKRDLPARS